MWQFFRTLARVVQRWFGSQSSQSNRQINNSCVINKLSYPSIRMIAHNNVNQGTEHKIDLIRLFTEWNLKSFQGILPVPELRWNSRLRTSAGRFIPSRSRSIIEIASYLLDEPNALELIQDTLGHELIHYWLWQNRLPYGHTPLFHQKMKELGVSRYNTVPRHRPFKHCYECGSCSQKIFVRKRLRLAACAACCNQYAQGKYHSRYKLKLVESGQLTPPQRVEIG
jgi:predicted SprT family Zn-dependent metalloprotease